MAVLPARLIPRIVEWLALEQGNEHVVVDRDVADQPGRVIDRLDRLRGELIVGDI